MKITLYQFPGGDGLSTVSPPCLRVGLALNRLGVEYQSVYLKSWSEVRKLSPTGRLPLLEIDGRRVADSIEILDELERSVPEPALSPADPRERVHDRLWEHFFNDHVYFLGYYMRWVCDENRQLFLNGLLTRAPFMIRTFAPRVMKRETGNRARSVGIAGKSLDEVTRGYERVLGMVEVGLSGGPYLDGRQQPGRGDLAAAATVAQIGFKDSMPDIARRALEHPLILEHARRVFDACSTDQPRWLKQSSTEAVTSTSA